MTTFRIGTTDTTKLSIEADGSEDITFAKGQTNVMSISNSGINILSELLIPTGNTLQRPSDPRVGEIRFNTTENKVEGYQGNSWINLV